MRQLTYLLIVFFSFSAYGAGYTLTSGDNDHGETVSLDFEVFYDKDFNAEESERIEQQFPGFRLANISVKKKDEIVDVFRMNICSSPGDDFSCFPEAKHPLSGATYSYYKELTNNRGSLYLCEENCGPRTPKTMIKDLWEGDPDQEYFSACAHNEVTGGVARSIVAVKTSPDLTSKTIAELHGVGRILKVKILSRLPDCLLVDHEAGQWVEIEVPVNEGGNSIKGWVFDANIEYGLTDFHYKYYQSDLTR